jgi:CubicO group peptidase (beta-lactamase class C family)
MPSQDPAATIEGFTRAGLAAFNTDFHKMVDDGALANVVTLVSRHGQIVHLDAYGVQDASTSPAVPVKPDSIFRIASMTKPITSAALMMLWEEGKFALTDPVAKHIPEFADLKVRRPDGSLEPQTKPQTMEQLMSHTAGFGRSSDYLALTSAGASLALAQLREGNLQAMIDKLAQVPLSYQPGTDWRYGPSVDIQGYVIEKLSGQTLDVFFEERLFKPLGMRDTGFCVDPSKAERVVRLHKWDDHGKVIPAGATNAFPTRPPKFLAGGGGLLSTAQDYWRFSQMMLNAGEFEGRRYLRASTVERMRTSVLAPGVNVTLYSPDTHGLGFGLGFAVIEDAVAAKTSQSVKSFYWGGAFGTWFWIDPLNDMVVIGMIQNVDGTKPDGAPLVREASARAAYGAMVDRVGGQGRI